MTVRNYFWSTTSGGEGLEKGQKKCAGLAQRAFWLLSPPIFRVQKMLALFRNNQFSGALLLIFYAALLRASWLRGLPTVGHGDEAGFFSEEILDRLAPLNPVFGAVAAFFAVVLLAYLTNRLSNEFRISNEATWFGGLFALLAASSAPDFLRLSPPLGAALFSILAFRNLFGSFNAKGEAPKKLFNLGFWLAAAGLAYPPAFLLGPVLFLGLANLRGFVAKERAMAVLGFLTAILLVWTGYFWFDAGGWFWEKHFWSPFGWPDFATILKNPKMLARLGLFAFLAVLAVSLSGSMFQKKLIQQQKFITITFWWMSAAMASAFFLKEFRLEHFVLAAPPLGALLGAAFLNIKNQTTAEVLHLAMLAAAIGLGFFS